MPTDDALVTALRRGMQATTDNLNPAPGLAAEVRRRGHKARGWRVAAYVAVPVVAGAGIVAALLVGGGPTAPFAERVPSVAAAPTTPVAVVEPATYRFTNIVPVMSCPTDTNGETVGKTEDGVWYVTPEGACVAIAVDWADSKPSTAEPISVAGYPDLYATTAGGTRTIYAREAPGTNSYHPDGGWVVMTTAADVPAEDAVKLIIVPSN
jgi:hypothetical protein